MRNTACVFAIVCSTVYGLMAQKPSVEKGTAKPFIEKGTGLISLDVPFGMGLSSSKGPQGGKMNFQYVAYKPALSGGGFVARHFMLGAGFGLLHGVSRAQGPSGVGKSNAPVFLLPSLVGRYYHMFTPKVGFFAQFTGEGRMQVTGEDAMKLYPYDSRVYGVSLLLSPHMAFFPKPNWGINVGVGQVGYSYSRYEYGQGSGTGQSTHESVLEPSLTFGASYFIRKKV